MSYEDDIETMLVRALYAFLMLLGFLTSMLVGYYLLTNATVSEISSTWAVWPIVLSVLFTGGMMRVLAPSKDRRET